MTRPAATAAVTASPARRRLGRTERRAAILGASASAFASGGYANTSMADIASAARISHLIVYRHFDSKEALYGAVLERAVGHIACALSTNDAVGVYGPTPAALLAAARADRAAFRVLWRHAAREPDFSSCADSALELLLGATREALAPIVAPAHLDWAARATIAYVVEAVLVWIEGGDERLDDRFVAATTAALRAGVRSWAKPS